MSQSASWTGFTYAFQSTLMYPDVRFSQLTFSSCRRQERMFYVSFSSNERTILVVSLFKRGVLFSIDFIDESVLSSNRLLSNIMVCTGSIETTRITPVKTEVSEFLSKTLFMCTKLKSVDDLGLKTAASGVLVLASFYTSPDDLSSFMKLVSLSLSYACSNVLAFYVCFRICPIKLIYLVTTN